MGSQELTPEELAALEALERSWGTHKRVRAKRKRRKKRKPDRWFEGRRVK